MYSSFTFGGRRGDRITSPVAERFAPPAAT
jgi:hypothetical protein